MRVVVATVVTMATVVTGPVLAQGLPDHATFTRVLVERLHGTLVDYAALQADPALLDAYLEELAQASPDELAGATRTEQLAFWINAYNACAMKLVIDHYPIRKRGFPASVVKSLQGVPANSIRQIPDTWDRKFCPVAGEPRALDEIEHEIIRPMGDPRIHFAVNCASRSCPVLAAVAYSGDALDDQLDQAVRRLVADAEHYQLVRGSQPTLRLNKVLDWYKDDFGGTEGVIDFLLPYLPVDDAEFIRANRQPLTVEYAHYDWTLNDTAVFGSGH